MTSDLWTPAPGQLTRDEHAARLVLGATPVAFTVESQRLPDTLFGGAHVRRLVWLHVCSSAVVTCNEIREDVLGGWKVHDWDVLDVTPGIVCRSCGLAGDLREGFWWPH